MTTSPLRHNAVVFRWLISFDKFRERENRRTWSQISFFSLPLHNKTYFDMEHGNGYVIRLHNAAICHTSDPFGHKSAEKQLKEAEMVLTDVTFDIEPGEFVYLLGRVGCGKSTLLKTLYAELQLFVGEGYIAGFNLRTLRRKDIPYLRRRIGIVFQDYQLLTDRNVFMNLYYVMKATGWKREDEIRKRIDDVLQVVDLSAKSYKMPYELSGGEQQRLVIARAILNNPKVLLADEPTGNLDPVTADGIMKLFQKIAAQGCAVVMSTHNTALLENYPARAILFAKGKTQEINLKDKLSQTGSKKE